MMNHWVSFQVDFDIGRRKVEEIGGVLQGQENHGRHGNKGSHHCGDKSTSRGCATETRVQLIISAVGDIINGQTAQVRVPILWDLRTSL